MESKGNKIENWEESYKELKTTYTENPKTPGELSNYLQAQFVWEDIKDCLGDSKNIKVLEVGCGGARTSLFLSRNGMNVTCADFSSEALRLAKSNFEAVNASGTFVQDDLLSSRIEPGTYDCIMSFGLLEHFEELTPLAKSLTQLIKPGGIQIHNVITKKFSTQTIMDCILYPGRLLRNALVKKEYDQIFVKSFRDFPHYENSFSAQEYCRKFEEVGNLIIKCEAGGAIMPFYALPFGVGKFLVRKFSKLLTNITRKTSRTESRIIHFFAPTFYLVCRKK
jgi:SAM-dependent methyltransferase